MQHFLCAFFFFLHHSILRVHNFRRVSWWCGKSGESGAKVGLLLWSVNGNNNGNNIHTKWKSVSTHKLLPNVCTGSICNAPPAARGSSLSPALFLRFPHRFSNFPPAGLPLLRRLLVKRYIQIWRHELEGTSLNRFQYTIGVFSSNETYYHFS